MRSEPTDDDDDDDDEGTLSVAYRIDNTIDNTGVEPLIILDTRGDPYTVQTPGEGGGGCPDRRPTHRGEHGYDGRVGRRTDAASLVNLGGRQTGHDWTLEDNGRHVAAHDLAATMGDRAGDVRLVWDSDSTLVETHML